MMRIENFMYFYPEAPQLCLIESDLFQRLSKDPNWIAEKKYNEQRLMLHFSSEFDFWNRHGKRLKYEPSPILQESLLALSQKLTGYNMFDAGLRHNKTRGVRHMIVIYDIYVWNSEMLIKSEFKERRSMLEDILPCEEVPIRIPKQFKSCFEQMFHRVIDDDEIEGLVMKNLTGKIAPGRMCPVNSDWMFKVREPSGRYKF